MQKVDIDEIGKKLSRIFVSNKNVLLAYLIGSVSRGEARSDSDIDIVLILNTIKDFRYGEISAKIVDALHTDNADVRVVLPGETDPLFLFQILKEGQILYETSSNARLQFETYALKVYYDTQYMRDVYRQYLNERLDRKQFAG